MLRQSHVCLLEQLCCDIDKCVATYFLCSFFNFVSRPSFYVATVFLLVLVATMFLDCQHSCHDRVLSPLNLIYCCSFILMLRHSLLVLHMFSILTKFLCRNKTFCIQLIFMSRPCLLYRDKASLPCVGIFIAT